MDVYIVTDGELYKWTYNLNEALALWDTDEGMLLRVQRIDTDFHKVYEAIPDTYGVAGKWVRVDKIGG